MAVTLARSQRELAAAVGLSQPAILKWIRHEAWPFPATGPWDVKKVQAWAAGLQEDRAKPITGAGEKINQAWKLEKTLHERVKRKQREGQLVDRSLLDRALEAVTKSYVDALGELERALPLQIAGLDPGQVERIVRDRVRGIREQLASRQVIELDAVEQAVRLANQPKARGRPGNRR